MNGEHTNLRSRAVARAGSLAILMLTLSAGCMETTEPDPEAPGPLDTADGASEPDALGGVVPDSGGPYDAVDAPPTTTDAAPLTDATDADDIPDVDEHDDASPAGDAADAGDATNMDVQCVGPRCTCEADRDCSSLLCLVEPDESWCAAYCDPDTACPRPGDVCVALESANASRATGLCVPAPPPVCAPCDDACNAPGLRCDTTAVTPQCRMRCPPLGCPVGTMCEERGGQALCVPAVDDCARCDDADEDGFGDGPGCLAPDCDDRDAAAYPGALEACNATDDDCDGAIDEGYDLASDPRHCGACDQRCTLPNAVPACAEGACAIAACERGFADCDGRAANGCEVALADTACGTCDSVLGAVGAACGECGTGALACDPDGRLVCEGDRGGDARNLCGGCAPLEAVPGVSCGPCGLGVWECAGTEIVGCVGETPERELNACGGCSTLAEAPGVSCGPCGASQRICIGTDATVCGLDGNCPPELDGVRVDPDAPTPRDRLTCRASGEATDPDPGDLLTVTVQWWLNGDEAPAERLDGEAVVAVDVGEQWACTMTASDGDASVSETSEAVVIADPCRNGIVDGDESAVDCGGTAIVAHSETIACPRCPIGDACDEDSDCVATASCIGERCASVGCPSGFVRVPSGTFVMGSPPGEAYRATNELPREVTLDDDLCVAVTETTQQDWTAVFPTQAALYVDCGASCPVESTTWFDAAAFANAMSAAEGREPCYDLDGCSGVPGSTCSDAVFEGVDCEGYRLPTEAEWEYLARAEVTTATPVGEAPGTSCDASALDAFAVGCAALPAGPRPVAERAPNAWGLHDVLGNVSEWTNDWYGSLDPEDTRDPVGPDSGFNRVHRGGSWSSPPSQLRYAFRGRATPSTEAGTLGFRLVARPIEE